MTLHERVEHRRREGEYPPGLEADLDRHFESLMGERAASTAFLLAELDGAVDDLAHFEFRRDAIRTESRLPAGSTVHRAIAKGVSRQIQGVLEQTQDQSRKVVRTVALMARATSMLADAYDRNVLQQLDDLQVQLAEEQKSLRRRLSVCRRLRPGFPGPGSRRGTASTLSTPPSEAAPKTSPIVTAIWRRTSSVARPSSTSASDGVSSSSC